MAADGDGQEKWNDLLQEADIYEVIDRAILVAAAKSPREFLGRRDGIALRLYTVAAPPPPATSAPVPAPRDPADAAAGDGAQGGTPRASSEKRSNVASCNGTPVGHEDDDEDDERLRLGGGDDGGRGHDNYGNTTDDGEEGNLPFAETMLQNLADQIEQDSQEINEVLRIKDILLDYRNQSASILLESLTRLWLMGLSIEKLKSTQIGGVVSALSKHKSRDIRQLVRNLIMEWRAVVDEWMAAIGATISDKKPDSSNPSAIEDELRLLTPPEDAGALLMTDAPAVRNISEFLHEIDDDGTVISSIGSNDSLGRKKQNKIARTSNHAPGMRRQQLAQADSPNNADGKSFSMKQDLPTSQELPLRQTKPHMTQHISHADGNTTLPMRQILSTEQQGPPLRQTNPKNLTNAGENAMLQKQGLPARQEPALRKTDLEKTQESRFPLKSCHKIIIKLKHSGTKYDQPKLHFEENTKKSCVQIKPRPTPVATARNPPPPVAVARKPLSLHVNSFDGIDGDTNMISRDLSNVGLGNKNKRNSVTTSKHTPRLWKQQTSQDFPNSDEEFLFKDQDLSRQESPLRRTKQHIPLVDGNILPMRKVLPTEQCPPLRQTNTKIKANAGQRYVLQRRGLPETQGTKFGQINPEKPQGPISPMKNPTIRIKLKPSGAGHDYEPRRIFEETPAEKRPCGQMKCQVPSAIAISPPVAVARKPLPGHVDKPGMPAQALAGQGMSKRKIQQASMRIERTKRRLHEAYQEAESAKKQRSVQFVELPVVPKYKQSNVPLMKPRKEKDRVRPWVPNIRLR